MSVASELEASRNNISASLRALSPLTISPASILPSLLPGLPESLAQLLKQLHYQITSLSLSFKPPVTPAAAVSSLNKLNDGFGRVVACVVAASGGRGNSALADEWKDGVELIGSEILRLLDVFANVSEKEQRGEGASNKDDNPYLVHTGLVWDAITNLSQDLSTSEVVAVSKKWRGQGEVMKDAWTEFKEFLEEQDEEGEYTGEDDKDDFELDDDDEFAELEDMMKGGKLSPEERSRAEAAKPLLGLHQILHSTIPRYLPLLSLDPEESYRDLIDASGSLTAAFDTAVASMYPKQEVDEIGRAITSLGECSMLVTRTVRSRLDRSGGADEKKTACRSFLGKWEDRLSKEETLWEDRGLSVASLGHALP